MALYLKDIVFLTNFSHGRMIPGSLGSGQVRHPQFEVQDVVDVHLDGLPFGAYDVVLKRNLSLTEELEQIEHVLFVFLHVCIPLKGLPVELLLVQQQLWWTELK